MKNLIPITKKVLILFMSIAMTIGLWSCGEDDEPEVLAPSITQLSPDSGFVGATVTIMGANFSTESNVVSFNGTEATITAETATTIATTVPEGATTGNVTVTANGLTSEGVLFTVQQPIIPTITSIDPTSGAVGDIVTITGTNFSTVPAENMVSFNGGEAIVTASTETTITTTVPATAFTGDVTVTRDGKISNGIEFTFTGVPVYTFSRFIIAEEYDAEEGENGRMANESSDLEMCRWDDWTQEDVAQGAQTLGIKFDSIYIASTATIKEAYIQFTCDHSAEYTDAQMTIYGEDAVNPKSYTDKDEPLADGSVDILFDITSRPRTTASAVWDIPEWSAAGDRTDAQKTVDISNIVKEIIAKGDWVSGSSLAFVFMPTGPSAPDAIDQAADGREAEAGPGEDAAELIIIWE